MPLDRGLLKDGGEAGEKSLGERVTMPILASQPPVLYPWNVLAGRIKSQAYPVRRL